MSVAHEYLPYVPADDRPVSAAKAHPLRRLLIQRTLIGLVTLFVVSLVVFAATQVLPGNPARVVLGRGATPAQLHQLDVQLGLERPVLSQYWSWLSGLLQGRFEHSLTAQESVGTLVAPRIVNSAFLAITAGVLASLIGVLLGLYAAKRRDAAVDHVLSVGALWVTALPEFVVGITFIILLATNVLRLLPAVSPIPPGEQPWQAPNLLVLPTLTLVSVTVPYIFRMTRAATIEALESDYVELARLKGLRGWQVLLRHAFPNALPPTIQAIGLSFLYLAGGIVVVEVVFDYPGLGLALYQAVLDKDIPTIQFIVVLLAAVYIAVNIITDVVALMASPRRRFPR